MRITNKMIDPQLRMRARLFNLLPKTKDDESFKKGMVKGLEFFKFKQPEDIAYEQFSIPRRDGETEIRMVVFKSLKPAEEATGVFWIHGGGFATSTPEQTLPIARRLIANSNAVVVMPDYRLSLQAPYPAGLHDCYDALLWTKEHASELGIRSDQLFVAGDSSGGNMAVACCLMARDLDDVQIACQIALYPALDDRMSSESMRDNNSPVVDSTMMRYVWKYYLGSLFGTDNVPAYAAPLRGEDFNNLPPAIGFVGGIDPLRDDAVEYFAQLKKAGVPVHFRIFEGGYHGFEEFCPKANVSKQAHTFFMESYKYAIEHYFAAQKSDTGGE